MTAYVCQPMAAYVCQPSTWEGDEELRPSWATGDPFSLRILSRGVFLLESVLSIAAPLKRQKQGAFEVCLEMPFWGRGSYSVNQFGLKLEAVLMPHLGLYRFKLWLLEGYKAGLFQSVQKPRRLAGTGPCEELQSSVAQHGACKVMSSFYPGCGV